MSRRWPLDGFVVTLFVADDPEAAFLRRARDEAARGFGGVCQ